MNISDQDLQTSSELSPEDKSLVDGDPNADNTGKPSNVDPQEPIDDKKATDNQQQKEKGVKPQEVNNLEDAKRLISKLQSDYDKTRNLSQSQHEEIEQLSTYRNFVENLDKDENLRLAIVKEYHPELLKPKNPETYVEDKLKEEFGEEFDYQEAPLHRQILYSERVKELYADANKTPEIPTLKEIKALRQKKLQQRQETFDSTKEKILSETKWDDGTFKRYMQWFNNLSPEALIPIFTKTLDKVTEYRNTDDKVNFSGQSQQVDDLDEFFGKGSSEGYNVMK